MEVIKIHAQCQFSGFYYQQQPQKGFYYDQQDADEENNAGAWKKDANATAVSERAKKIATAKVAGIMIANNHRPGASENRVLTQVFKNEPQQNNTICKIFHLSNVFNKKLCRFVVNIQGFWHFLLKL